MSLSVLVVDDANTVRTVLSRKIVALGHNCTTAAGGQQAWDILQTFSFDAVIADWMMPGLDGLELCRRIRSLPPSHPYTYVMIATGQRERERFLEAMEAGADDFLTKPVDDLALQGRLMAAERVTGLHRQLAQQRSELEELNRRSFEEGRIDPLTRVNNRLRLNEDLAALQGRVRRYHHTYSFAIFDIDFFKRYNDTHGHLAGDDVLRKVARSLQDNCRSGDTVYRYGGEEFLIVMAEQTLPRAAQAVERHRAAIRSLGIPHQASPHGVLTISAGVANLSAENPADIKDLIARADHALYFAKDRGRNCVALDASGGPILAEASGTDATNVRSTP